MDFKLVILAVAPAITLVLFISQIIHKRLIGYNFFVNR